MENSPAASIAPPRRLFSTRKIIHMSMLIFAFLLPFLTWVQAAGCALLALVFNVFILPHLDVDLGKRPSGAGSLPGVARAAGNVWAGIVIYPLSVLGLIVIYPHNLYIAAGVWAIMALGDGMASVAGESLCGPRLPWNNAKTWTGFCAFIVAGTAGAYALTRWVGPGIPPSKALMVCVATAIVGALVETVPIGLDDNATVPLVCGAFMYCAYFIERSGLDSNLPYLGRRLLLAFGINLVLAVLALSLKTVTWSGAACGFVLGVAVYLGYGYKSFALMFAFFLLGSVATRLGYARKAARGVAERRGGARSWREALANSLAAAFFSILVITTHHEAAFLVALVAAFAEAAGDTVSSEIGQWISDRAYLITTLRPVPAGENGGISIGGTLAGFSASALLVGLGFGMGLCGRGSAVIALAAAFAGNLLDSLLGATIERKGLVTNGIVNFAGTSFAGGLALSLALHQGF